MNSTFSLVSVVMPSMNQINFIPAAVESVLGQSYPMLELIVADGGSTDGSVEWLKSKAETDSRLRFFSESDTGPANAVNKALKRAKGTIIGWLNSDDLYAAGAVVRAVEALSANRNLQMVYGHGEHIDAKGRIIDRYPTQLPDSAIEEFADGCFICQPTVFFRRGMTILLGPLDENLKTAFDFEYWLRAFAKLTGRIGFVDAVQAYSRLHEDCITMKMRRRVALESMQVLKRHLGRAPRHWLLSYFNEIQSQFAGQVLPQVDMSLQIAELLTDVAPLLSEIELARLRDELGGDSDVQPL